MLNTLSSHSANSITSLAIGKFDGMHLAHFKLLEQLDSQGAILCIHTNHARALTPHKESYTHLPIFYVDLARIKNLSGEAFVEFLIRHFKALKRIVVGYDFKFGKDRKFSADDLHTLCKDSKIEIIIVPEYKIRDLGVHSSMIRECITTGNLPIANLLLGRIYTIHATTTSGQNLGSRELYPTINLVCDEYILPQDGVYASVSSFDGVEYKSVSFVGNRLSTDREFSIETHILGHSIPVLPPHLTLGFVQKIRQNRHFSDLQSLKAQITQDIATATDILQHLHKGDLELTSL
ncbi:bifunctional riboflavin kinase/FAD synthetase [uncultured Helicobacter sp.]|uniref:bifunctional riboflavin kinase/FAD synthetase n=1 Tax=uncultured Helicobacter sp. TaxID=175537 RepID=UPI001C39C334|nr:bifunctional riboflavin kinase/FAD synthetase [Candidatus Helicobacter avicola]